MIHRKYFIYNLLSGSTELQCSVDGKCRCKPGVTGDKCDQCEANYWNFPDEASLTLINNIDLILNCLKASPGCESCECMLQGSLGNTPSCDPTNGACACKQNVEGQR